MLALAIPLVQHPLLLAVLLLMAVLIVLAVARLAAFTARSVRDSRAGRIPGPEAERFMPGQERRLGGDPPADREE